MFQKLFKKRYIASLSDFKLFYDDLGMYGNPDAENAFYFVPGIDGSCGQSRFCLPVLVKVFGHDIFFKCLHIEEFSAKRPIWDKYTIENTVKKKDQLVRDLNELARKHAHLTVVCSSNGFYDFLFAYSELSDEARAKAELLWIAVAPDRFEPTLWDTIFHAVNGQTVNGNRFWAAPESNLLQWINPETSGSFRWKKQRVQKLFLKSDIESRFKCFGITWSYNSGDSANMVLDYMRARSTWPIPMKSYILAATNDGFWQGKPLSAITDLLDTYLSNNTVLFKKASHVWVLAPDATEEILTMIKMGWEKKPLSVLIP